MRVNEKTLGLVNSAATAWNTVTFSSTGSQQSVGDHIDVR